MKFKRDDKRKVKANVEMTPLIDVVFQLLIFFMLSSTFVVQTSIPIEVPEAVGSSQLEAKELTITLKPGTGGPDDEGKIYIDDLEVSDWDQFIATLSDFNDEQPDAMVLVRSDKNVPFGRAVEVMGLLSEIGIEKYGVAAQQPGAE